MEKKEIKSALGVYSKDEITFAVRSSDLGKMKKYDNQKCPDCDAYVDVPDDTEKGHILSCSGCGLELEVKKIDGKKVDLQEMTIEGEDWGE